MMFGHRTVAPTGSRKNTAYAAARASATRKMSPVQAGVLRRTSAYLQAYGGGTRAWNRRTPAHPHPDVLRVSLVAAATARQGPAPAETSRDQGLLGGILSQAGIQCDQGEAADETSAMSLHRRVEVGRPSPFVAPRSRYSSFPCLYDVDLPHRIVPRLPFQPLYLGNV